MTKYEYEEKKAELETQLEELKQELEELEKEAIVEKRWKPSQNEEYFAVSKFGTVDYHMFENVYDEWAYLTNNCFKTEEEAVEHQKKLETYYKFKNYVEEHNDEIDWKNGLQEKWYLYVDCNTSNLQIDYFYTHKHQGTIYATSKQILEDAIKYVGEETVKKYILEVE